MHKFINFNINHLAGDEVKEIEIGDYNILFTFVSENFINIFGKWAVLNPDGSILNNGNAEKPDPAVNFDNFLHCKFEKYSIPNPGELHIKFSNGLTLVIYDNDPEFECCAISPDIYI
jgi:hypothetical protein